MTYLPLDAKGATASTSNYNENLYVNNDAEI